MWLDLYMANPYLYMSHHSNENKILVNWNISPMFLKGQLWRSFEVNGCQLSLLGWFLGTLPSYMEHYVFKKLCSKSYVYWYLKHPTWLSTIDNTVCMSSQAKRRKCVGTTLRPSKLARATPTLGGRSHGKVCRNITDRERTHTLSHLPEGEFTCMASLFGQISVLYFFCRGCKHYNIFQIVVAIQFDSNLLFRRLAVVHSRMYASLHNTCVLRQS